VRLCFTNVLTSAPHCCSYSQGETIRKEIQTFLVIRALYKRLQTLTTTTAVLQESIDDLCATITDRSFLSIEEKNLLPANCTIGKCKLTWPTRIVRS
jgi:hypothetical protein